MNAFIFFRFIIQSNKFTSKANPNPKTQS